MSDNFWFLEPFRIPEDPLIAGIYLRSFRDRKALLLKCGITKKNMKQEWKKPISQSSLLALNKFDL